MDRTGYQRTTSGLCSKMPPTAIWRLFVHTPIAGATDSDRFSRGGFHSFRVGYFFVEGKVRLKEKD